MDSLGTVFRGAIPITMFDRGETERIFGEVRVGEPKLVMKGKEPECVLMSPQKYLELISEIESLRDTVAAVEKPGTASLMASREKSVN